LRLADSRNSEAVLVLRKRTDSCERAIERLLGIPKHSLSIIDPELIELFLAQSPGEDGNR
jgi:hypothetical protein